MTGFPDYKGCKDNSTVTRYVNFIKIVSLILHNSFAFYYRNIYTYKCPDPLFCYC